MLRSIKKTAKGIDTRGNARQGRWQIGDGHLFDQLFGPVAMGDKFGNRQYGQTMSGGKALQIRASRHLPVIPHDLANCGGRLQASKSHQVDPAFGMTVAHENATLCRAQRKDVSRRDNVSGPGFGIHSSQNRARPIMRRYAGGYARMRLDRNRERRCPAALIAVRHGRQLQPVDLLTTQRQTDQAPPIGGHEVYSFRSRKLPSNNEIPLVFAVFVINQDHHSPLAKLAQGLG